MEFCAWCGHELNGWYLEYHEKKFCRHGNDICLKNYLFEEADDEIEMDKIMDDDYRMDFVTWMEDRGLD